MNILDILTYLVVVCFTVFIISVVLGILVVFLSNVYMKILELWRAGGRKEKP